MSRSMQGEFIVDDAGMIFEAVAAEFSAFPNCPRLS